MTSAGKNRVSGVWRLGQGDIYVETIGNITTKQYKNILKSKQRNQEKKIQEVPLYKRISNNACGTALWGEQ